MTLVFSHLWKTGRKFNSFWISLFSCPEQKTLTEFISIHKVFLKQNKHVIDGKKYVLSILCSVLSPAYFLFCFYFLLNLVLVHIHRCWSCVYILGSFSSHSKKRVNFKMYKYLQGTDMNGTEPQWYRGTFSFVICSFEKMTLPASFWDLWYCNLHKIYVIILST